MKQILPFSFLMAHALLWIALAVAAYANAGSYTFASCWQILIFYIPPLRILLLGMIVLSPGILIGSIFYPALRGSRTQWFAGHSMIVVAGLLACNQAASAAAGQVSCL
ncbi:hypothetical protein [Mycoplana sp. MJR14]|uniref:hypothetical protein n=1 Tax=Mycoplana sp. MJR14 TaxID=3032583 RepID=UPI0023DC0AB1|nr:hypothetical protein [Mycoplana sp. MJR14]MDF1635016.1 hypothetical protein [Mycoplana sp. MJR14]